MNTTTAPLANGRTATAPLANGRTAPLANRRLHKRNSIAPGESWRMVPAMLSLVDEPTLRRMLQAAAARTIHACTLPFACSAFQEYLSSLLALGRRQQLAAVYGTPRGTPSPAPSPAPSRAPPGGAFAFHTYAETQAALEEALRGKIGELTKP